MTQTASTRCWTGSGCARGWPSSDWRERRPGRHGTGSTSNRLDVSARYSIVEGDPRADRQQVLAIAARNRGGPPERFERRFAKYYEHNPFGPPSVFFARDNGSEALVGMTALFPTAL